ncbi:MAG: hypothetical protein J2P18_07160 [Nocardia sp.]|nr:hypothetical protein [Nocardia sp.]
MAAGRECDWRAATLAVCLWPAAQLAIFVPLQVAIDRYFLSLPAISLSIVLVIGFLVAILVARRRTSTAMGAASGVLAASILLLTVPLALGIIKLVTSLG